MNPAPPAPQAKPVPEKTRVAKDLVHERPLVSCRFDPKGRFVFGGSEDSSVVRWDLQSGAKTVLKGHESWPFALAGVPDGSCMLSGAGDGRLSWWSMASAETKPIRSIDAHAGWINSIEVNREGTLAATCGNDRLVKLWSVADGSLVATLPGHEKPVYRALFDPSGRYLVSADLQGRLIQWELATRKEARRLDAAKLFIYFASQGVDYGGVRDLSFSPDGKFLACCGLIEASNPLGAVSNPANLLLDWAEGKDLRMQRPKEDLKGVAWGIRYHPDGFLIMVSGGTSGGLLLFYKPDQVNEFFKYTLPNTGRALDLHPDGLRIAVAHHDGHLRVYSMDEAPKA
ncbi:WD40 repeat domain-containing protein [Singulisphaera rosea]